MLTRAIELRLRKLETARRPPEGVFFLLWGRSPAELDQGLADVKAQGTVTRGDRVIRALWQGHNGTPAPRWVASHDLSAAEDDALMHEIERRAEGLTDSLDETTPRDPRVSEMSDVELYAVALGEAV